MLVNAVKLSPKYGLTSSFIREIKKSCSFWFWADYNFSRREHRIKSCLLPLERARIRKARAESNLFHYRCLLPRFFGGRNGLKNQPHRFPQRMDH
jgi:hypothetical protein